MTLDPLQEAREHLSAAKYQAELAGVMLAGAVKPDADGLRQVHVQCLDAEVAVAEAHSKIASLAQLTLGSPEWERMRSHARQARLHGGDAVADHLDAATGEGRR